MPKLKTKKGVAKRFKLTKNKKIKYSSCNRKHLLSSKKSRRLRRIRRRKVKSFGKEIKYLKRVLPYG